MRRWIVILPLMIAVAAQGALVHVYQETLAGGVRTQLSDETKETGATYTTQTAPTLDGYIFTHWSISTTQSFISRDRLGRAKDATSYTLYETTTLTANYLPQNEDTDADGVADGWELYWYGDLFKNAASDTDGDGYTFAEELSAGMNPLMEDISIAGGIAWADGELLQYNPDNLQAYTIRSEPEGVLFATVSDSLTVGATIPIPSVGESFAYWTVDGVRQSDRHGRAKDAVSIIMPDRAIEIVAVSESDEARRNALYWYGDASVSMDSDTDGDGYTFAEELSAGTNPLMADESISGGIAWADGELLQYNPYNLQAYTIRSEPEGSLFATVSDYLEPGAAIPMPSAGPTLAYWMVGGVRQADRHGRATDTLSITMPSSAIEIVAVSESDESRRNALYWYGDASVSMDSDTDGDGYTFAEELSAGTNPLMEDISIAGGIVWADGDVLEVNLQPYEQARGVIVDGGYSELFTSPVAGNGGTSRTFDGAATPTVVDLNGDGLFDFVVETAKGTRTVFINNGGKGNPRFVESAWDAKWYDALAAAKTNTLDGLTFDTPPVNAVSWSFADVDKDGVEDLLVADVDGRIWYYRGTGKGEQVTGSGYVLQHKVWGGSYAGFAQELKISAVDWDDDGDVDLVCGTADGKLMLLNDPRIGRPTGLMAEAGATSVVLSWDASANSRVRGYGVYRGADADNFSQLESLCPLPRYRDIPPAIHDWWYCVTGKSRFYVAGNSEPVESETDPSEPVRVSFGGVDIWLNDTSSFTETNVSVIVSINNSMGLAAKGFAMTFAYDAGVLEPVEMKRTGLTAGLTFTESASGGVWQMTGTGGEIGIGAGRFLELVFRVKPVHDVTETTVTLTAATVRTTEGQGVSVDLPKSAKINISDANPLQPALVSLSVGNAAVETGESFELPFTITSTEVLTSGVFVVTYDSAMLEWKGAESTKAAEGAKRTVTVKATESGTLPFVAKEQHSVVTNFSTTVEIGSFAAVDCNGFAVAADGAQGMVLIKNAHPILPAVVGVSTEDRKVDTLEEVTVPFKITSTQPLASGSFTVEWDPVALERVGGSQGNGSATISATGDFTLTFLAKDQHDITSSKVRLTAATVTDINGFTVYPNVPVVSTIIIHDAHPLLPAKVAMTLGDVAVQTEGEFEMVLAITSTEELTALKMNIAYDMVLLELRSGVLEYSGSVPSSVTLRFYAKENHAIGKTAVTITPVSAKDHNGFTDEIELPASVVGNVILADSNPWRPATVAVGVSGAKVDTRSEFMLPVTITSNETLTNFAATVSWDGAALELRSADGVELRRVGDNAPYQAGEGSSCRIIGGGANFTLAFYAKDQHDIASADVALSAMSAVDNHGLVANAIADVSATVLIHDAFPLMPAKVSMTLGDVAVQTEGEFEMVLAITSTEELTALKMNIAYDMALLELRSGTLEYSGNVPSSVTLRFYAKENHTIGKTAVTITPISANDHNGFTDEIELPASVVGNVILADSNPWQPATVAVGVGGAKVDTRSEFVLPVTITSNETLTNFVATVSWNGAALELRSADGVELRRVGDNAPYQAGEGSSCRIIGDGSNFTLVFYAKDQHDIASADVTLSGISAVDNHGLIANAIADTSATVLIHDAYPLLPAEVAVKAGTVSADTRATFDLPVTVTSSKPLTNFCVTVGWDNTVLELRGASRAAVFNGGVGVATLTANVTVPEQIVLTFYAKDQHTVTDTAIMLSDGTAFCSDGLAANITLANGRVMLADSNPPVPATFVVSTLDARAESGKAFVVPLGITSVGELTQVTACVSWDGDSLTFDGAADSTSVTGSGTARTVSFAASGEVCRFGLDFTAKPIAGLRNSSWVRVTAASATGANGLAATCMTALPVESVVLIVRTIGKYDPGDIDGDGMYTDADMTLLQNYIKYLSIVSAAPQLAGRYASWKLTGNSYNAADVNSDGKRDANDVSMLVQLIAAWEEANK